MTRCFAGFRRAATAALAIAVASFYINVSDAADWKATWTTSPHAFIQFGNMPVPPSMKDVTVRQVVHLSAGGTQVRVRFSNEFGSTPLTIGAASVGRGEAIRPLSFGGAPSIVVPPGAPALSDAINLEVKAGQDLAVSVYLPKETPPATMHMMGLQKTDISQAGNFTQAATLPVAASNTMRFFLSAVEVANAGAGVIVAFGDSITDGVGSAPDTNQRWPDLLAERLRARKGKQREFAVVNQGISGNRIRVDGAGINALARFDRDVLSIPGASHVIVLIGINDIGIPGASFGGKMQADAADAPTAADLIAGYKQMIARAHEHGLKIFGATLVPFAGTGNGYYSPEKEKVRLAVNEWIRGGKGFDGVIDFDAATRDPANPDKLLAAYDSGDHLHPSSAGYKAMAESIDLSLFD